MTNTQKYHLAGIVSMTAVLTIIGATADRSVFDMQANPYAAVTRLRQPLNTASVETVPDTQSYRIAARLQKRLRKRGSRISPPLGALENFVRDRQALLKARTTVSFVADPEKSAALWDVSLQRYPLWLKPEFTASTATLLLDNTSIESTLAQEAPVLSVAPVHAVLKEVQWSDSEKHASRVVIDGIAKSGYALDAKNTAAVIASALSGGTQEVSIALEFVPGKIINESGVELGKLQLLSTGRSDFKGSDYSRIANVKKAITQHVNNVIVGTDEIYSFNSTLGGPVTQGNGWYMAKVIFNGGDLEYAPGGGICQTSTTVYRAALLAGLPVLERKAHSLYVTYYKQYGVGIDATIYPGSQDLTFQNDTGHPLIIQSYYDGTEAYVNIYGTADGRSVALEGPYFAATAPEEVKEQVNGIASNEIIWLHKVHMSDGTVRESEISSRYKQMPRSLITEYAAPETILHAAAPSPVTD